MTTQLRSISFIGAGNMAEALARGVLRQELLPPAKILMVDVRPERREHLRGTLGVRVSGDLGEAFHPCETMLLAVKPQDIPGLLDSLRGKAAADDTLQGDCCRRVISICAGVTIRQIEEGFPRCGDGSVARVVRVMPNMAAAVGEGAAGVAAGSSAEPEDVEAALAILGSVGMAIEVEESQLDAVTGLSGSGPAYVFRLMEAMIAGGVASGLSAEASRLLTLQTVLGAARLAMDSDEGPAELRRRVTSPGGTTAAGLKVMDERGFFEAVSEGVQAATRRGKELGGG